MYRQKLDAVELARRRAWLGELAAACTDAADDRKTAPEEISAAFALAETGGVQVYESYTDEELLNVLRSAAIRLGHSPSQREVFWVYRGYIKQRFEKWPYALQRAGLHKAAGSGGVTRERAERERLRCEQLLNQVRVKAAELGRVPHPADLPEVCRGLRKQYATWGELLAAAGIERVQTLCQLEDLEPEYREKLAQLSRQAYALGRAPLRTEVAEDLRAPLVERCGSWRNALYQIGLEPVTHITPFSTAFLLKAGEEGSRRPHRSELSDCYYKVLGLSPDALAALDEVKSLAAQLGHTPRRGEVDDALRKKLQAACGSWSNALFQVGLQPARKEPPLRKVKISG